MWLLGGYSPGGTMCDWGIPVEAAVGRLLGVVAWRYSPGECCVIGAKSVVVL